MKHITSVVAHIDHGKTTLLDSLISAAGTISKSSAGDLRYLDTRKDEQIRGITLKLSAIGVDNHIFIDTPGHVDFEHLLITANRLCDSVILVIDAVEGITPRTFSLVKNNLDKPCVLVINKVDKIMDNEIENRTNEIILRINGLFGTEKFNFMENNVIIACGTLCYGINKNLSNNIVGKKDLKNAVKLLTTIKGLVSAQKLDKLKDRFKLKGNNPKYVMSTIFPLSKVIRDSLASVYREAEVPGNDLCGILNWCLLRNPEFSMQNVLFVTRLFSGEIKVGDMVKCKSGSQEKLVKIEEILSFDVNELKSVDSAKAPDLVAIKGDFLKSSTIGEYNYDLSAQAPFFKSKLILNDDTDRFKSTLKVLGMLEQSLKIKINKFGEFEFVCHGKVHFEKILADIENFSYKVVEFDPQFCEGPTTNARKVLEFADHKVIIEICASDVLENEIIIQDNIEFADTIKSIINLFKISGSLVNEQVKFAKITVFMEKLDEIDVADKISSRDLNYDEFFTSFKRLLTEAYEASNPTLYPLYFYVVSYVQQEMLGNLYNILSKYNHKNSTDDFNQETDFFSVSTLIPSHNYNEFVEEIRISTKGTVYLEVREFGYEKCEREFDKYIYQLRKKKGLFVEEKIVSEPEKQRTLKK